MQDVAPDQEGVVAVADAVSGVAGGVAGEGDGGYAGGGGLGAEAGHAVPVGGGHRLGGLDVGAHGLGRVLGVAVDPEGDLVGVGGEGCAGEHGGAVGGGEPGAVVGVEVGEEDEVDVAGLDAGGGEVGEQAAAGGAHGAGGTGVDEGGVARGLDDEGVDGQAGGGPAEAGGEEGGGLFRGDVGQDVEREVEVAVVDGGDGVAADLVAGDAGEGGHSAASLCWARRPSRSWMNCQATRPERAPRVTDHSAAWA